MRGSWEVSMVLDKHGRVLRWPKKRVHQDAVIAYLATKFEAGRSFSEKDVNTILQEWHTFNDWALLRRTLWDLAYLEREPDGSRYWRSVRTAGA